MYEGNMLQEILTFLSFNLNDCINKPQPITKQHIVIISLQAFTISVCSTVYFFDDEEEEKPNHEKMLHCT